MKLKPGQPAAAANTELCEKLLAAKPDAQGNLTRESLAQLQLAMQKENRPAAELLPVARLLGKENEVLLQAWLTRLKDLPIPLDKPLKDRLTIREDGLLDLDLSGTKLANLDALASAPLGGLNVSGVQGVSDLAPLRGMRLATLVLTGTVIKDLSSLSGMTSLTHLELSRTKVVELSPLTGLPLVLLALDGTPVTELGPLKGMPLERLNLSDTRVTSFSALKGMPLKWLAAHKVPVLDFTPLTGTPLKLLEVDETRVRDLGFLRGMPLNTLMIWGCEEARNLRVLSEIPTLEVLLLPGDYWTFPQEEVNAIAALKTHPGLKQIATEWMRGSNVRTLQSKDLFWKDWAVEEAVVGPLHVLGIKPALTKLDDGTYYLDFGGAPLTNLPPIPKDFPLSELSLHDSKVRDLSGLRGLRLRTLWLTGTFVQDLRPLEGMPLSWLSLGGPNMTLTNLDSLRSLPLKRLDAHTLRGTPDVSALAAIPTLEQVTLPRSARNVDALRKHPHLKSLAFQWYSDASQSTQSVEEFWKDWEMEERVVGPLRALGINPTLTKLEDGSYNLDLARTPLTNLPPIPKDFPISELSLYSTKVRDLSGLRGMRLRELRLNDTFVEDLRPLEGMPLEMLSLGGQNMTGIDLTQLGALPLKGLLADSLRGTPDVSPLAGIRTLESVTLPPLARNVDALRNHPNLKRLSFKRDSTFTKAAQSVEEFWEMWDKGKEASSFKAPARSPHAGTNLVDLSRFYNAGLQQDWQGLSGNSLAALPDGVQTLAQVEFDVRGLIQLTGEGMQARLGSRYPASVAGIPIHRKFARLHVLHGTGWWEKEAAKIIGAYVLHYADGRQLKLPVLYGEDVRDWWCTTDREDATRAAVAWTGQNPAASEQNGTIRLFKRTWDNPYPEVAVERMDFTSTMTTCAPFLVALTLE